MSILIEMPADSRDFVEALQRRGLTVTASMDKLGWLLVEGESAAAKVEEVRMFRESRMGIFAI